MLALPGADSADESSISYPGRSINGRSRRFFAGLLKGSHTNVRSGQSPQVLGV